MLLVNAREEIYSVTPSGDRVIDPSDITVATGDSGPSASTQASVSLESGFYQLEAHNEAPLRWASSSAKLKVVARPNHQLRLDIDPTPEAGPMALEVRIGAFKERVTVEQRSRPAGDDRHL